MTGLPDHAAERSAAHDASPLGPPVIDVDALRALAASGVPFVVADVRWYLDGRDGRAAYEAGHLPGAVFVDLEADLSRHDLPATEGRHPLPTPDAFATAMDALGITDDTVVVGCDDAGGITSGRLVVMLRMLGRKAAVLDGGVAAWDGPLETGPSPVVTVHPGAFTPRAWPSERLAGPDDATSGSGDTGVTIDARSAERFTGAVTQIDPRPGHVPGATSAPWDAVLDPVSKRFRSAEDLRGYFAGLGVTDDTETVAYCGSGVSACMNVLAMERAGLPAPRLYVASFSGWSADGDRAVETDAG